MNSFFSADATWQSVVFWVWIAAALCSVVTWNFWGESGSKWWRLGVYAILAGLSLYIIGFRIYAMESDPKNWCSILPQVGHLGGRVALKAVFFLVLLVQLLKLPVYLWKRNRGLFFRVVGFAIAIALYFAATIYSWPGYIHWILFSAIAASGSTVFYAWWKRVHLAYGLKLEKGFRRFRFSLVGILLPDMWVAFLYKYPFTRFIVWCLVIAAGCLIAKFSGEWTGEKTLPHLFGLGFGFHWLQLDARVSLPFLVLAGSILALAAGGYILYRALRAPGHWAMRFAAATACLMILLSWWNYRLTVHRERDALKAARDLVGRLSPQPSPDKDAFLTRYRRLVEYRLGTREWNAMVFHRVADEPYGLPYRFPGFLIGVEQANRYLIGISDKDKVDEKDVQDKHLHDLLDNRRRTFVSHIAEFRRRGPGTGDAEIVETNMLYNLYESADIDSAYHRGFGKMDALKTTLMERLDTANIPARKSGDSSAYTHFLVYCMGWNTDQQESIRNYNSLMGFLLAAAREDSASRVAKGGEPPISFRPLVIGLSWPSEWSYLKPLSYLAKAGDADETGLVWGSYLLKRVIAPLKEKHPLPVILIGHSFGTRVLSRAVASHPDWRSGVRVPETAGAMDTTNKDIDLFIGLQGAFSANRFVTSGKLTSGWMDAGQYLGLEGLGTRFVLTWSDSDAANPVAAYATGANHVGGKFGHWFALQHQSTFWPCVYTGKSGIGSEDRWKYPPGSQYDSATGWTPTALEKKGRIFSLDLSSIVKEQPYGKGGGAHSDIYTPEIGRFLWKTILAFAPGGFPRAGGTGGNDTKGHSPLPDGNAFLKGSQPSAFTSIKGQR